MTFSSTPSDLAFVLQCHLVASIAGLLAVITLSFGLYNRYLHPLRHIPGPFWGSISSFYFPYLLRGNLFQHTELELHQRYGTFVRLSPNLISISDPLLLPQIYHPEVDKTAFYHHGMLGDAVSLFQILDHKLHSMWRRTLAPMYSMKHALLLEECIDERLIELQCVLSQRYAETGKPMNWADWNRYFIYDVFSQSLFGEPLGYMHKEDDVLGLISAWQYLFHLEGLIASMPWLIVPTVLNKFCRKYLLPHTTHGAQLRKIELSHERLFEQRLKNPYAGRPGNLFDSLLGSRHPNGDQISLQDAKNECMILMIVPHDTSSAFIGAFINNLIQHPKVYQRLISEIAYFEETQQLSDPVVKFVETSKMTFFQACAKETLRLTPSAPMILPRHVSAAGVNLNGTFFPGGTEVGANPFVIHRDTSVFGTDANIFRPERWLTEDPDRAKMMDKYMLAWGYGDRNCLGKNVAQVELHKLLVQFLRDFDIQSSNPDTPWKEQNWAIAFYFDQWITIRKRKPS